MNFEILEQIEGIRSGLMTEKLLVRFLKEETFGERFLRATFDDTVYGLGEVSLEKAFDLTKVPRSKDIGDKVFKHMNGTKKLNMIEIQEIVDEIEKSSGDAQLVYIKNSLSNVHPSQLKWICRLLMKDLKCGVSIKTVNKAFKEIGVSLIEKFEVQLCGKIDNLENYNTFPCIVGVKYDGFRCIAEKKGELVKLTSRQGKDVSSFLPEIIETLQLFDCDFVIDGEIMGNSFNDIQKRIGNKPDNLRPVPGLHYRVFDMLRFNNADIKKLDQEKRCMMLYQFITEQEMLKHEVKKEVDNIEDLKAFYKKACDAGEEGIVIKLINKPYEYGSRKNWIKVKPIFENTFKIIGQEYGKGKNKDLISTVIVTTNNGKITSGVGSGFTDSDREYLTGAHVNNRLIGKFVDVAYNEITMNQQGEYSLRFPRFLKFRDDKDKADDIEA